MKTKFTKGEWEPVIYSGEHKVEVWAGDDQIYANGSVTNKEEEFANAHLIASAPDMYKSLKRQRTGLLNLIDLELIPKSYIDSVRHEVSLIDNELAKARGE